VKKALISMSRRALKVIELIGNTPMVELQRLAPAGAATVLAKLESLNPGGSVKDRIALAMVEEAEASGRLKPGATIVEPTSGNTGIALALIGAAKGYKVILTMPQNSSRERVALLARYGARAILTPPDEGMAGAVEVAERLVEENADYFMPQQFNNPANPEIHRRTTAPEILKATGGQIDAFVAGIGTGGTITGVGEVLKREIPNVKIIGVEPARSPLLSKGRAGIHGIQGIGANFIPRVLNRAILDEVMLVEDEDAYDMQVRLAREEGLLAGSSAGANVFAALQAARRLGKGNTIVTILPDTGERYLSLELEIDRETDAQVPLQQGKSHPPKYAYTTRR
jgi:cysteine synthase A